MELSYCQFLCQGQKGELGPVFLKPVELVLTKRATETEKRSVSNAFWSQDKGITAPSACKGRQTAVVMWAIRQYC